MASAPLAAAEELIRQGQWDAAAGACREILAADPNHAGAWHLWGLACLRLGHQDEALAHFSRAVELDSTLLPARVELGRMLLNRNQPAQALPHLAAAATAHPEVAELRRNVGNALHGLGQLAQARAAYEAALVLDPNLAWAQANLALVLEHEGDLAEALAWATRAVAAQPENAQFWAQLAALREKRNEYREAQAAWQRTLELRPHFPRAHVAVGRALQRAGRADEAIEHYQAALRLQANLAEAYDCLAGLYEELGEQEQAVAAARASLRIEPRNARSRATLARLLGRDLPNEDLAELVRWIADEQVAPASRAKLLLAHAHVLDAQHRYAEAAAAAGKAHPLALEHAQRNRRAYDATRDEQFAAGLIAGFDRAFFERLRGAGLPTRRPVFVFGLPRSGSTLVDQVLASHPQVFAAGELSLALETFQAIPAAAGSTAGPLACLPQLDAAALGRLASDHLQRLDALDQGRSERIVDKEPANYQFLGLLAACFPQATFIHTRRDLRDVAVSCWLTDFEHAPWTHSPQHIGAYFRRYLRLMRHWQAVLPAAIHEVVYEDLVGDFEATARRLVAACGLEWHDDCLHFHRTRRQVRTSSAAQVRQPVYSRSRGRWRHYEQALAGLFAELPSG